MHFSLAFLLAQGIQDKPKEQLVFLHDNFWAIWLPSIPFSEIEVLKKKPLLTCYCGCQVKESDKCPCPHWEGEDSMNLNFIKDQRSDAQHAWMYFTFFVFLHQILTFSHCWKGQKNNIQVLSVEYSLEIQLTDPISAIKSMRQDNSVTHHTTRLALCGAGALPFPAESQVFGG